MFGIGFNEVIIILVLALIIIGPKKLPDIAKALGKGYREFKKAFDDVKSEFDLEEDDKTYDEIRKPGKDNIEEKVEEKSENNVVKDSSEEEKKNVDENIKEEKDDGKKS